MISLQSLQAKIKFAGFDSAVSKKSSSVLIVHTSKGTDRKGLLEDTIAPLVGGTFHGPSQLKSTARSSKGGVTVDNWTIIAKDVVKGVAVGTLDARAFSTKAKREVMQLGEKKISCYVFYSYQDIEESIIAGCHTEKLLGDSVAESFQEFFKTGNFTWGEFQPVEVLNKLGVYAGELLSGWVVLRGHQMKYITGANPFRGKAKAVYIPDDPSFEGVDSFVEMQNGDFIAISSKFDRGAAASLFASVVTLAMQNYNHLPNCTLKTVAAIAKKVGPKSAKKIVYEWGCNHFLKLNIRNPDKVMDSIRAKQRTPEVVKVIGAAMDAMTKDYDNKRLDALPFSLTSYFNMKLADALMKDSKDEIISLIQAKEYYQMTLDKRSWQQGKVKFTCTKAGKTDIQVVGNKSTIADITAKQGWINYIVKKA